MERLILIYMLDDRIIALPMPWVPFCLKEASVQESVPATKLRSQTEKLK